MIHLHTSFLIRALVANTTEDAELRNWLRSGDSIGISTIAWAEFLCGPIDPAHAVLAARIVEERIPFDDEDARVSAELFNGSGRRRGSMADCMIAATALRAGARIATVNASDFRRREPLGVQLALVAAR